MSISQETASAGTREATSSRGVIALLAACTATGPAATNLFVPALPHIRADFDVSVAAAQTMLTTYLVAFALGLLVCGPVSDRHGRRPIMIGGLTVLAAGSLMCALARSLPVLAFGRVVQALGTASAFTVARASVADLFQGAELARRIATLTMVIIIGTTISPYLGGFIADHAGWELGFWILFGAALLLIVICLRALPETRARHARTGFADLGRAIRSVLANPVFFGYSLQVAVIFSLFMVFISLAPYIMTGALGRSASEFGIYYILISVGYFLGNLYVSKRAHSTSTARLTALGLWIQLACTLLALGFALAGLTHPLWLFGPMFPLSFGQGLALPTITARAVGLVPGFAGAASSLLGFAQMATAAVCVQAMGWASTDTAVPMLLFCSIASSLALVPIYAMRRA